MNLADFLNKIKSLEGERYWLLVSLLMGLSGFGLGRLSQLEEARPAISVDYPQVVSQTIPPPKASGTVANTPSSNLSSVAVSGAQVEPLSTERVYASKTGRRYYYSWCKSQVKEENKVWFENADQAKAKGLNLGVGCREPF